MRLARILVCALVILGCARLRSPPVRPYRVSGTGATTAVILNDTPPVYVVEVGEGVSFAVQADSTAGLVRVTTTIRNDGPEHAWYDVRRAVVAAVDGRVLRLDAVEEEPAASARTGAVTGSGAVRYVLEIRPGESVVVVRRYSLANGFRLEQDLLLLARLSLADEVLAGTRSVRLVLRLDRAT